MLTGVPAWGTRPCRAGPGPLCPEVPWILACASRGKEGPTGGSARLTELQALARSTFERLLTSVLNTFIFSTRVVSAVSVASPTFS